jgi:aminoglycoside phosphotransferase (APT) family kinase protein
MNLAHLARHKRTSRRYGSCIEPVETSFDPSDPDMVADAFVVALRHHHPLAELASAPQAVTSATSTWVWFVELAGVNLPVAWQGPLVLRVFSTDAGATAEREDRLSTFLTAQAYPAPSTLFRGQLGRPAHPFVLQQRLPGHPANELMTIAHVRKVVSGLGRLQGQLHRMSTVNFPLRRLTAAVYIEHDLLPMRQQTVAPDPDDWLGWLRRTAADFEAVSDADIVVCHGDFHPLNAVAELTDDGIRIGIVDWTDACLADRHMDLGRSVGVYRFGSILSSSPIRQIVMRVLSRPMRRTHLKYYRAAARTTVDDRRLVWWEIVHVYRAWLQLTVLAEGFVDRPRSATAYHFPAELRDQLLDRCRHLRHELGL